LARGYARLSRAPALALLAAEEAERAATGRAGPEVLAGRAQFALGRYAQAYEHFARARKRASRSLEAPRALHDYAASALAANHEKEALAAYRLLVPRAGLLARANDRQRAYLEAALLAMAQGEAQLPEAVGYVSEARRRRGPPGMSDIVLGTLALALDRQGRHEEARGVAREAGGPWGLSALLESSKAGDKKKSGRAAPGRVLPVTRPGELAAVVAMLAEPFDAEVAKDHWQAYLDSPAGKSGPWSQHARKKLSGGR
jgi:hypothetical protein